MKMSIAGDIGRSLKENMPWRYIGRTDDGEFCGCYLLGALLAVTEPGEWDALLSKEYSALEPNSMHPHFWIKLTEKFPWVHEPGEIPTENPYEDKISSWHLRVSIIGDMTHEEMQANIRAIEPDCGVCCEFDCTCTQQAEEVTAEYVTQA